MTLRLKVGKKGYIIIPKAIRDILGINEGDELIVEVGEGLLLKPTKGKVNLEYLKAAFTRHLERLKTIKGRLEPVPGELAEVRLEEEFD